MKMTMEQTKLVYLTMQLELKAKEYQKLCDRLDQLKNDGVDPNDERLNVLKDEFQNNLNEIKEIKKELQKLKDTTQN